MAYSEDLPINHDDQTIIGRLVTKKRWVALQTLGQYFTVLGT